MLWSEIHLSPDDRTLRQFALLTLAFTGAVALRQALRWGRIDLAFVMGGLGLLIGVLGMLKPQAIRHLYVGWMILVFPIGWLISRILLAALYYGVITPVGFLLRVLGRDTLRLRHRAERDSYWELKLGTADMRRYFHQF
jgi:hypothetical protein